jgi:hypothetical protein
MLVLAPFLGVGSVLAGLMISAWLDAPFGPAIAEHRHRRALRPRPSGASRDTVRWPAGWQPFEATSHVPVIAFPSSRATGLAPPRCVALPPGRGPALEARTR